MTTIVIKNIKEKNKCVKLLNEKIKNIKEKNERVKLLNEEIKNIIILDCFSKFLNEQENKYSLQLFIKKLSKSLDEYDNRK